MVKIILLACVLLINAPTHAETTAEILTDATLPANLTNSDITTLALGFSQDQNTDALTNLVLGVGQTRTGLLTNILDIVASTYPSAAESLIFSINQYLPTLGMSSYVTMAGLLEQYNQTDALAALNATNNTLLAQLENQGLEVESAAGVDGQEDFNVIESVIQSLNLPTENPAQLSAN